jgi:flagellar biosynthetic protein FlhB
MAEGDKRHAPTARRLQQAAEKGDVARSTDLPKAATAIAFICVALGAAAGIGTQLENDFAAWLAQAGTEPLSAASGWGDTTIAAFGPLLALIAAIAAAASIASGGWVFSLQLLKFDFTKLWPSYGLGQLVSRHGMAETLKALLKFIIIGGIGAYMIVTRVPEFAALAGFPHPSAAPVLALCGQVLTAVACGIALLAGADYGVQLWLHRQKLRMTDSEIRDEMKDVAGNPHVRNRQRMIARKLARARQMHRIAEASVIVTNPTHYAVAIRYRRGVDRAPLLLAKGVGLLAEEIISRGRANGVPIVEAPPLARAVYRHVEPGEHMPVALYRACAEVLAYVWKMQRWRAQGGKRPMAPPVREGEIDMRG